MPENSHKTDRSEKEYSISEFYFILKKYRKIILIVASFIFSLTIYFTLITKPVYKSTGLIMVSEDQKSMSMLDFNLGANRNYIENEIEVLKSTSKNFVKNKFTQLLH